MQFFSWTTIGSTALENKERTTGFDYLRLGLSLSVVANHCLGVSSDFWSEWFASHRPIIAMILPAFFALSGFLVTGSLFRNAIPDFLALRIIRLVPALAVEVGLSALVAGAFFTTLSLSSYLSSRGFWAYFLNIVGEIHMFLPGVFDGNPVNAQLWTIPYEMKCYGILVGVAALTRFGFKKFFPTTLLIVCTLLTVWCCYTGTHWSEWHPAGRTLVVAFLWACAIYMFQDRIPCNAAIGVSSLIIAIIVLLNPRYEAAASLPIAYLTIYVGLQALPRIPFGDLSYGIFLFHLPIMQIFRFGAHIANPYVLLGLTTLTTGVFALASWRLIEKPCLSRKREFLQVVNAIQRALLRTKAFSTSVSAE